MEKRLFPVAENFTVEILVFIFCAVRGILQPKRLCVVDRLRLVFVIVTAGAFAVSAFTFVMIMITAAFFTFTNCITEVNFFRHECTVFRKDFTELELSKEFFTLRIDVHDNCSTVISDKLIAIKIVCDFIITVIGAGPLYSRCSGV